MKTYKVTITETRLSVKELYITAPDKECAERWWIANGIYTTGRFSCATYHVGDKVTGHIAVISRVPRDEVPGHIEPLRSTKEV